MLWPSITELFSYNKSPLNVPQTFMLNSTYIYLKYKIRKNVSILISWITYSPLQIRRLQIVPPPLWKINVENLLYSIFHLSILTQASTHPWQTHRRPLLIYHTTDNFLGIYAAIRYHSTFNHRVASNIHALGYALCSRTKWTCGCQHCQCDGRWSRYLWWSRGSVVRIQPETVIVARERTPQIDVHCSYQPQSSTRAITLTPPPPTSEPQISQQSTWPKARWF